MLLIGLFTLLLAIALYSLKITATLFNRITIILLIYSAILSFNGLYPLILNAGVGIYGGLFHVTTLSQSFDLFIYILGAVILLLNEYPYFSPTAIQYQKISKPTKGQVYDMSENLQSNSADSMSPNSGLTALPIISEYSLIIIFTLIGATLLISSNDLVSMYLSIELQSFSVYILASIYRESESATSAGLKYFLLGGLSSGFILLGSSLLYGFTGLTNFENLYIFSLVTSSTYDNLSDMINNLSYFYNNDFTLGILQLAVLIICVGFLFKIAAAPFHNWAPDVYDGVPTVVTTWLTVMPKISILLFLLESSFKGIIQFTDIANTASYLSVDGSGIQLWSSLLIISATLSLLIGTLLGLAQHKIKRLLAYSTISHVGFILLALSITTEESIESFLFYIIQYSLTNLNAFFIIIAFGYLMYAPKKNKSSIYNLQTEYSFYSPIQFISQIRGQFKTNPVLVLSLAVCLFSMAGIPPLMGFFAKQMVLYSAIHEGYFFVSVIAIVTSVISAAYYLRIVKVMYFDRLTESITNPNSSDSQFSYDFIISSKSPSLNYLHSFTIACLTMVIVLFVVNPTPILNSVHLLTLSLFYN